MFRTYFPKRLAVWSSGSNDIPSHSKVTQPGRANPACAAARNAMLEDKIRLKEIRVVTATLPLLSCAFILGLYEDAI
jgi:hypothetical protein